MHFLHALEHLLNLGQPAHAGQQVAQHAQPTQQQPQMVRAEDGSMVPASFYQHPQQIHSNQGAGIQPGIGIQPGLPLRHTNPAMTFENGGDHPAFQGQPFAIPTPQNPNFRVNNSNSQQIRF